MCMHKQLQLLCGCIGGNVRVYGSVREELRIKLFTLVIGPSRRKGKCAH